MWRSRFVGLSVALALAGAARASDPLPPLSPILAAPVEAILVEFEKEGSTFAAMERAYEEVQAAFLQLRKRSFYQLPTPKACATTMGLAMQTFHRIERTGLASANDLEGLKEAGLTIGMGTPPYENASALERYRDYADLSTGPRSIAVATRLREIVLAVERALYPDTGRGDTNEEVALARAKLRQLALIELTDFIAIETRRMGRP